MNSLNLQSRELSEKIGSRTTTYVKYIVSREVALKLENVAFARTGLGSPLSFNENTNIKKEMKK